MSRSYTSNRHKITQAPPHQVNRVSRGYLQTGRQNVMSLLGKVNFPRAPLNAATFVWGTGDASRGWNNEPIPILARKMRTGHGKPCLNRAWNMKNEKRVLCAILSPATEEQNREDNGIMGGMIVARSLHTRPEVVRRLMKAVCVSLRGATCTEPCPNRADTLSRDYGTPGGSRPEGRSWQTP